MSNLAALDETLDHKGMEHTGRMDKIVWQEWLQDKSKILVYNDMASTPHDQNAAWGARGFAEGQDRFVQSKQRVGQDIFREMILSGYRSKCALTGIEDTRLLNASHIVGWAEDEKSRLDPSNGICLNALHDRAFDRHLISFDQDCRMLVSKSLPDCAGAKLEDIAGVALCMPDKFLPGQDSLERHRRQFFDAQSC
ncbi:MAG: HNH endonuclease [Rhodobacterales bacterium]